jgi:predicted nucleic acid-binding protein
MWIAVLRWQNADVLARLKQHPPEEILLCSVVLAELWYGRRTWPCKPSRQKLRARQ